MICYADELLKNLKNNLDLFSTYHIPITVDDKNIKEVELEKDSEDNYKINIILMETE